MYGDSSAYFVRLGISGVKVRHVFDNASRRNGGVQIFVQELSEHRVKANSASDFFKFEAVMYREMKRMTIIWSIFFD